MDYIFGRIFELVLDGFGRRLSIKSCSVVFWISSGMILLVLWAMRDNNAGTRMLAVVGLVAILLVSAGYGWFRMLARRGREPAPVGTPEPVLPQSAAPQPAPLPAAQSAIQELKPQRSPLKSLGLGCLGLVLCILVGWISLDLSGVLSGAHQNQDSMPAWSPDGSRIAFVSRRDGYTDIYVMDADGSHVRQLTRDPFAMLYLLRSPTDTTPAWSPDGKQIVFSSGRDNGMMTYIDTNLYVMNANGERVVRLTSSDNSETLPAWSPDGKRIAFVGINGGMNIYVMDADGSNVQQLTNNPAADTYGVAWSADSRQIYFAREASKSTIDLCRIDANGDNFTILEGHLALNERPAVSPDGRRITFFDDSSGTRVMVVQDLVSSERVTITFDQGKVSYPTWSPDGTRLAFSLEKDGESHIYIMNADGTNRVQLTGR